MGNQNADLAEKMVKDNLPLDYNPGCRLAVWEKVIFNSGSGEILVYKMNNVRKEDWYGNHGIKN